MSDRRPRSQTLILDLLKAQDGALSAQDIYMALRQQGHSTGLATVYRALETLKREGKLQVRTLASGESLYSSTQEDRHHLTCVQCGKSIPISECPVHELEEKLNHSYNFKIYYHMLEFFGLCRACQMVDEE